ncbi:hypothetical protein AVP1_0073 [Aeromonas phage AVP1]|nr:hypothetical protein AVP1_0073 [Aeromonas phage AVP1]
MNEKEKGILIIHSPTDIEKSKVLQYVGERRIGNGVETTPVIHLDRLKPEEADNLGLIMEPSGQITVKQPVVLSGTGTVTSMGNIINAQLRMVNEVCKSIGKLFKESGYEGCRTPAPFRNDKGIYRQHKRQRKHK